MPWRQEQERMSPYHAGVHFFFVFNFTIGHGELELKLNTDRQLSMFLWIYTDVYKQIYDWGIGQVGGKWCTVLTSLGTVHMQIYFDSCVFQFSFFVFVYQETLKANSSDNSIYFCPFLRASSWGRLQW